MERRVSIVSGHLNATNDHEKPSSIAIFNTSSQGLNPKELYPWVVRDNRELREAIFAFLQDPLYSPNYYLSLAGFRELTSQRVQKFVQQRFFSVNDYIRNPLKFQAALESLSFCDYSLAIKSGVHFTLCGGTIAKLGTEYHHREFLPKMDTLELPGCFGMTELGHGSNVMGIETTATWDGPSQSFIINTPTNAASKYWIGGAAQTAKICAVFAQLYIAGKWEGPHVFVVRLRDDGGALMPGVRIADNGPKQGLNGVDNGQIWFNNVGVPRMALLDRYAKVDESGRYTSPISNPAQRFGTMVSGLTTGRMLIAQAAVDAVKVGVTIALRYSAVRPQFGEKPILSYVTHQRRIFPALATAYAMHLSMSRCKALALEQGAEAMKQVHILSSGLKAAATWHRTRILQDCRECCGGMGFLAANRIGPMLNDMNVDVTFEGDNTVMMQQVAKPLIDSAIKCNASVGRVDGPRINFNDPGLTCIGTLLRWRRDSLAEVIAKDVQGGHQSIDSQIDRAITLGWAAVDAVTFDSFVEEIKSAPQSWQSTLNALALLYGLTRVESGMTCYLSRGGAGFTQGEGFVATVRSKVNTLCNAFAENNGQTALAACDAFGIPDFLLQAPIALKDWRQL